VHRKEEKKNMFILAVLLVIFICLLISYFWILKSHYDYFIRRHIPGPPPRFFFGHYLTLWNAPSYCGQIQEWTRQFGSIYGLFEGTRPMYVVSDINFLQEVFIKQFSTFHSRRTNFLLNLLNSKGANLFTAHANQWRRQRHVINPTFTTLKLKTMTPLMNKCIESMLMKVNEMNGREFNIYTLYQRLTMDVICK
jgi:cytochrome P450